MVSAVALIWGRDAAKASNATDPQNVVRCISNFISVHFRFKTGKPEQYQKQPVKNENPVLGAKAARRKRRAGGLLSALKAFGLQSGVLRAPA
jgi:hypothetical protein